MNAKSNLAANDASGNADLFAPIDIKKSWIRRIRVN